MSKMWNKRLCCSRQNRTKVCGTIGTVAGCTVGRGGATAGGAATGAAIDSAIPIIGTAVGGILGGAIGFLTSAAAGGAAGKVIDDIRSTYKCTNCGKEIDG